MKTEDEARKCWCPFARVQCWTCEDGAGTPRNAASANKRKNGRQMEGSRCIASDCMAWRQRGHYNVYVSEFEGNQRDRPEAPQGHEWLRANNSPNVTEDGDGQWCLYRKVGYCGLAGKP